MNVMDGAWRPVSALLAGSAFAAGILLLVLTRSEAGAPATFVALVAPSRTLPAAPGIEYLRVDTAEAAAAAIEAGGIAGLIVDDRHFLAAGRARLLSESPVPVVIAGLMQVPDPVPSRPPAPGPPNDFVLMIGMGSGPGAREMIVALGDDLEPTPYSDDALVALLRDIARDQPEED